MIRNKSIRFYMFTLLILNIVISSSILFTNYFNIKEIKNKNYILYKSRILGLNNLLEADRDIYQSNLMLLQLINEPNNNLKEDIIENLRQANERYNKFLLSTNTPQENEKFKIMFPLLYNNTIDILDLLFKGNLDSAKQLYFSSNYQNSFNTLRTSFDINEENYLELAEKEFTASNNYSDFSIFLIKVLIFVSLSFSILLIMLFNRRFLKPVIRLTSIVSKAKYDLKSIEKMETRKDEIGVLTRTFLDMQESINNKIVQLEEEIDSRKKLELELKDTNLELNNHRNNLEIIIEEGTHSLKKAMKDLQLAQAKIIENEKLALLGTLVSGLSHQINTPLGIGITAITFLHNEVIKVDNKYKDNLITKKVLNELISTGIECTELIESNFTRISNMVNAFKSLVTENSIESKQTFNLQEIINISTRNLLLTNCNVTVNCSPEITICSYPRTIVQIITNLLDNSIQHGFNEGDSGKINISAILDISNVTIIYSDNGKGIPESILDRVFEPFFTSNYSSKNIGLGLNIVYNLVNKILNGNIKCESKEREGTTIYITFPT